MSDIIRGATRAELVKVNKYRYESLYNASLQSESIIMLSIGIHYNHQEKRAFTVVSGQEWISREDALDLLRDAIQVMEIKIIEDQQNKPK